MVSLIVVLGLFALLAIIGYKDWSIVDIAWGPAVALAALAGSLQSGLMWPITICLIIWGARLGLHIGSRHKGEDPRYTDWRIQWGRYAYLRALGQVFLLQAILSWSLAVPVWASKEQNDLNIFVLIGIGVFVLGLAWEAAADRQLQKFINDSQTSGFCTIGLWQFSRHPNYFGEALLWMGIGIQALALGAPIWAALFSPLLVYGLVRHVSGVPILERRQSKKDGWDEYVKQVPNAFWPSPSRR